MNQDERKRKENKHRKIILKREDIAGDDYRVVKVINTLEAVPRHRVSRSEVQDFINRGFTVEVRA